MSSNTSFFIFQVGEDDDNDDGDDGDDDDEVSVMDQPSVAGVVSRSIRDGPFVAVAQVILNHNGNFHGEPATPAMPIDQTWVHIFAAVRVPFKLSPSNHRHTLLYNPIEKWQ